MTTKSFTPLPYDFDLLYDLKSVEDLHAHLTGKMRFSVHATDAELLETMASHNIPLPAGYVVKSIAPLLPAVADMSPDECRAQYAELLNLVNQLHHHAKRDHRDDNTGMDRMWVLNETGKALAKQPGLTAEQRAAYEHPWPVREK